MNEIENKSQIKSMKQNIRFLKSSKINKSLAKLIKKKREREIANIRKEWGTPFQILKAVLKRYYNSFTPNLTFYIKQILWKIKLIKTNTKLSRKSEAALSLLKKLNLSELFPERKLQGQIISLVKSTKHLRYKQYQFYTISLRK